MSEWSTLSTRLQAALGLAVPPIAITFADSIPASVAAFDDPMPTPNEVDGRTGRVAAGCVFWMKSTDRTFSTVAEDHANCSVGSVTHGFKTIGEVAGNADVAALLNSGWVTMELVPQIPVVTQKPAAVLYGPLADADAPDVVLLRITGRQLMVLSDAFPGLRIEGKPQCHIVAAAKEQGAIVASVGCQLSRVRTGMANGEMTVAIPAARLDEAVTAIERTGAIDNTVARYASAEMARFA